MRKLQLNKYFKLLIITLFCFVLNSSAYGIGESQIPVSESYSDVIQSVQKQTSRTAETVNGENSESTLAHRAVTENIDNAVKTVESENNSVVKNEIRKQTKSKTSITNLMFKFLFAMLWVAISSVFIFLILLAYKKLILKDRSVLPTYESMEHSLDTPKKFKEAIKIFLDKTKWN